MMYFNIYIYMFVFFYELKGLLFFKVLKLIIEKLKIFGFFCVVIFFYWLCCVFCVSYSVYGRGWWQLGG